MVQSIATHGWCFVHEFSSQILWMIVEQTLSVLNSARTQKILWPCSLTWSTQPNIPGKDGEKEVKKCLTIPHSPTGEIQESPKATPAKLHRMVPCWMAWRKKGQETSLLRTSVPSTASLYPLPFLSCRKLLSIQNFGYSLGIQRAWTHTGEQK